MRSTIVGCLSFLSFMAPLLGGCISTRPKDLAFVSVQVVDQHDQLEIMPPSADPAFGLINESQREKLLAEAGRLERPHQMLLKIEFSSQANLAEFMLDHSFNLGSHAFFCNRPKDYVILSAPSVYWRGVWLNGLERDPIEAASAAPPFVYYFFAGVTWEQNQPSNPPIIPFNLWERQEDICFSLKGGNGAGLGFKSNTVVVPKDAIAAALQAIDSTRTR